jgi:thiopurine S-methyltransferase
MEEQFWQLRWKEGKTGFHEKAPNRFLTKHFDKLSLAPGSHVFVPLCGKSTDLDWLLNQGHQVTGIEFNAQAVDEVFERMSLTPEVSVLRGLRRLTSGSLTLWQGDLFALQAADLGAVDAVYDRAALVALPETMRSHYAGHLINITKSAQQFLVSFSYDQSHTAGPPFSVPLHAINALYDGVYDIQSLATTEIEGPLADRCTGQEQVWKMSPKPRSYYPKDEATN